MKNFFVDLLLADANVMAGEAVRNRIFDAASKSLPAGSKPYHLLSLRTNQFVYAARVQARAGYKFMSRWIDLYSC